MLTLTFPKILTVLHFISLGHTRAVNSTKFKCPLLPQSHFPKINLTLKSDRALHHVSDYETHFEIPHVHVGSRRELIFECNGSYPVEWIFQTPKSHERGNIIITSTRYATVSVPNSYVYSAKLHISAVQKVIKETKQTCRSVHDKACLQTTVVAKWSGPSQNKSWSVQIRSNDPHGIVLPEDGSPNGKNANCSILFTYDDIENTFCCKSKTEENLTIALSDFTADDYNRCMDPTTCRSLYSENNCGFPLYLVGKCLDTAYNLPHTNDYDFSPAGVIVCHAESRPEEVSATVHYFYSLPKLCKEDNENLPKLYFSWHDIKDFEFVSMCEYPEPVYVGEKINFTCVASLYYTSAGMHFAINRTTEKDMLNQVHHEEFLEYKPIYEKIDKERGFRNLSREIFINDTDIKAIICLAPVRNSTLWIDRVIHLNVLERTSITFEGGKLESVDYKENLVFRCQCHGKPKPILTWHRGGEELTTESHLNLTFRENDEMGWTEIIFPNYGDYSVFYGEYTCRAKNQLETKEKIFVVLKEKAKTETEVLAESSTATLYYLQVVVLPISILIILAIFGLLVWKIWAQTRKLRSLTHAEIDEFMNGKPDVVKSYRESNYEINSYASFLPYNKKYEILKEQLEIDANAILGSGAYGLVLKGTLTTKSQERIKVAIKTVKPMDDVSYIKALLSELKIMAFIGKHVNIINLIGAYTTNIQKREIYIATEFCDNGNVLSYVKRNRRTFVNLLQDGAFVAETSFVRASYRRTNSTATTPFSTINLLKWSSEISAGMDFLAQKKVIHGDLAARNIFLTIDLTVKIGDFGLSKQLFEYVNYTKKNQTPLPWKWLAVECLQDMQFSVKSDVWAFGVTVWEIFTLGQNPYPGCAYHEDFITQLIAGKRLTKPIYVTDELYEKLLTCWDIETTQRPDFNNLKSHFDAILSRLDPPEYLDLIEKEISNGFGNTLEVHRRQFL